MVFNEWSQGGIVRHQLRSQTGICACTQHHVFCTGDDCAGLWFGARRFTAIDTRVHESARRGPQGHLLNSAAFASAWWHIKERADLQAYDWTVKVDPDTVFFPCRLQRHLHSVFASLENPEQVVYLTSCRSHLSGAIEVLSRRAVSRLVRSVSAGDPSSLQEFHPQASWLQETLRLAGVPSIEDRALCPDARCSGGTESEPEPDCAQNPISFHPLRDLGSWTQCWHASDAPSGVGLPDPVTTSLLPPSPPLPNKTTEEDNNRRAGDAVPIAVATAVVSKTMIAAVSSSPLAPTSVGAVAIVSAPASLSVGFCIASAVHVASIGMLAKSSLSQLRALDGEGGTDPVWYKVYVAVDILLAVMATLSCFLSVFWQLRETSKLWCWQTVAEDGDDHHAALDKDLDRVKVLSGSLNPGMWVSGWSTWGEVTLWALWATSGLYAAERAAAPYAGGWFSKDVADRLKNADLWWRGILGFSLQVETWMRTRVKDSLTIQTKLLVAYFNSKSIAFIVHKDTEVETYATALRHAMDSSLSSFFGVAFFIGFCKRSSME